MLPPGVQMDVRDDISVDTDCGLSIARQYCFTNNTQGQIEFGWRGRDRLPSRDCRAVVNAPGVHLGITPEVSPTLEWDLPDSMVGPEGTIKVHLTITVPNFVMRNPLRFSLQFQSAFACSYTLALRSPMGGCLEPADCTFEAIGHGERVPFIKGHDGVLRPERSVRVSARTGPWSVTVSKPLLSSASIPLLRYFSETDGAVSKPLSNYVVVLIPHLLRDSLAYIESLCAAGLCPEQTFVIGIPYSIKIPVGRLLWQQGFPNIELPTDYPFTDVVRQVLKRAIKMARDLGKPIIIVEDGGYAGPMLHSEFAADLALCHGIVEQTRNGIWAYKEIEPKVPLLNVAESKLKLDRESPLIGDAIVFNVRTLVQSLGRNLERYKTIMVGYGSTGSHVARALRKAGIDTMVFDQKAGRRQKATDDGYVTSDSLADLLGDRQLIIGCTGEVPFKFDEILAIQHGAVFANASSKRREIDYEELEKLTDKNIPTEIMAGVGHKRRLLNGRDLTILANGYPVNFVGESVPDEEIAFILALLQQSAIWLTKNAGTLSAGVVDIPNQLQDEIETHHDRFLGERRRPAEPVSEVNEPQTAPAGLTFLQKVWAWIRSWC